MQEQQVEFGSLGSVVLPTNGPNYPVGMQSPPPPSVPAVVPDGRRSSNGEPSLGNRPYMAPNRRRYLSMTRPYLCSSIFCGTNQSA